MDNTIEHVYCDRCGAEMELIAEHVAKLDSIIEEWSCPECWHNQYYEYPIINKTNLKNERSK